jgi:hypothetical protein
MTAESYILPDYTIIRFDSDRELLAKTTAKKKTKKKNKKIVKKDTASSSE